YGCNRANEVDETVARPSWPVNVDAITSRQDLASICSIAIGHPQCITGGSTGMDECGGASIGRPSHSKKPIVQQLARRTGQWRWNFPGCEIARAVSRLCHDSYSRPVRRDVEPSDSC